MDKLGRTYTLTIERAPTTPPAPALPPIVVTLPFTIEFDITRNTLTSANVCQIRIYNLNKDHRNDIRFNISNFGGPYRGVQLRAGYGKNTPIIFSGNISQAWSVREGVNFITQIECFDGGFAFNTGTTNKTFPPNTPLTAVMSTIALDLPHVTVGAIGNYPGSSSRGNSYTGSPMDLLRDLSGNGAFVDKEKLNILGNNEYIADAGLPIVINASTGLLNTPVLETNIVHLDMIFEPSLDVGRQVLLTSLTENSFNGAYKITAVKHRGMISDAVCGDAITTGEFFYSKILTPVVSSG